MKKIITRLVVLFAIVALVFGSLPTDSAQAAKKKSKTSITVSTQEELVKALKSGKYKKITIKTDAKVSFTLAAKYSNSDLKIVVDAKNATFNSKGTVGSIVVNEAKTVKEYASGNNITVNDEKLTFKAMEGASVEKLKIASETGEVKVVNNGDIGRVDVTGESKVDVEQNGSVGRLYVAAAAEIGVTGTSEEKLAVTVKPEAAGAAVKSELPVKVNAYADVDLQLEKGAENSAVTLKNEDAGVKLENNTDKKVTVTDSDGEKQTVKKGEDLTSDNYVGKPEEPDTPEGGDGTVTEQPKEEEKKEEEKEEEKKEEEKKDDTASTGTGSTGDTDPQPYIPYVSPEDQIRNGLSAATGGKEVWLTQNISLTKDLEIPANVGLVLDGFTLNAGSNKIVLDPGARIVLFPGSKLILEKDSFVYSPDNNGFTHAEIQFGYDAELKIGDCSFVGTGSEIDPVNARIILENNPRQEKVVRNLGEGEVDLNFIERSVRFDFIGGSLSINSTSGNLTDVPKAFGTDTSRWASDPEIELKNVQESGIYTTLEINPLSNVLYDKKTVTFNNTVVYEDTIGVEDWINAYLDYGMYWSAVSALKQGKTAPTGIERTEDANGDPIVTISEATIHFKKNIYVQGGATLIAKNVVYDALSEPAWKVLGGDFNNDPGIRVSGNLKIDSIKSTGYSGENHELIRVEGAYGILTMGDRSYKIVTTDSRLTEDNWAAYGYFCWNAADQNYGFLLYTWDAEFTLQASDGAEYFDVVKHPINGELVPHGTAVIAEDFEEFCVLADSTSRWTKWDDTNGTPEAPFGAADYTANNKKAIRDHIDFTEAVVASKADQSAEYGNKKPLTVEAIPRADDKGIIEKWIDENGAEHTVYDEVCICGMDISVANDTTIVLKPDARISLNRGANLTIDGVSYEKSAGKMLCLLPGEDGQDSGRIDVKWGASITIGGIVFQTENNDGSWDDGRIGLSLDVVKDWEENTSVRIQLGEGVTIKKTNGSYPTAEELNHLGLKVDIQTPLSVTRDDGMTDEEKEALHQKQALEFPSIKLGNKELFNDRDGKWEIGEYTRNDNNNFTTDSVAGLKAIAKVIEPDHRGDNDASIWSNIHYTGTEATFNDITLRLPATIYFDADRAVIQITNGAKLTFSVVTGANSLVNIGADCVLGTTQGDNSVIGGRLVLGDKATIRSQMGSALVIVTGGAFELGSGGVFECGCKRFIDENQGYTTAIWFENNGGTIVDNSAGWILLIDMGSTPVDMEACVAQVSAIVSGSSIRVIPGTINIPQNGEPQQGQPGQQVVIGGNP